jgi:hypothetical protein
MPARPIKEERERWYVYLLLKQFKGDTAKFARTMDLANRTVETWKAKHADDMKEYIKKERKTDKNGGVPDFDDMEVPTPEALMDDCLKRLQLSIAEESDPSKLAKAVDTLSKLRNPAESGKEKKSISDMVLESLKK